MEPEFASSGELCERPEALSGGRQAERESSPGAYRAAHACSASPQVPRRRQGKGMDAPAVLDLSSQLCKVGFAGEGAPRHIFRRPRAADAGLGLEYSLEALLRDVFARKLMCQARHRHVLVCESLTEPTVNREAVVKVRAPCSEIAWLGLQPRARLPAILTPATALPRREPWQYRGGSVLTWRALLWCGSGAAAAAGCCVGSAFAVSTTVDVRKWIRERGVGARGAGWL